MCQIARAIQILLLLTFVGFTANAYGELLYYDPFLVGNNSAAGEYTLGQLLGQNPTIGPVLPPFLDGPWGTSSQPPSAGHVVQAGPITGSFFPTAGGSVRASFDLDGARAGRLLDTSWNDSTTGTHFLSFLVNFGASEQASDEMGFRALEFWNAGSTVGNDGEVALAMGYSQFNHFGVSQNDPETARIAVRIGNEVQVLEDVPASFNEDGLAHLVVMKFELEDSPFSDDVSVFLNPVGNSPTPSALFADIDFTLGAIGVPSLYGGTGRGTEFDEIRIGTEFEDVIPPGPEPGECTGENLGQACYQTIVQSMHGVGFELEGDLNNDGRVDLHDLRIWRDNRADMVGVGILGVPEPSGVWMILVGSVVILTRRAAFYANCTERALKLLP